MLFRQKLNFQCLLGPQEDTKYMVQNIKNNCFNQLKNCISKWSSFGDIIRLDYSYQGLFDHVLSGNNCPCLNKARKGPTINLNEFNEGVSQIRIDSNISV
jgi:hypothetical protein